MLICSNIGISTGEGNETRKVNIFIDGEKIVKIEDATGEVPCDAEVIDGTGLLALPSGIDPHVHFDTPGYEEREDFAHGTRSAIAGGTTTIIDMPDTSIPPITNLENLNKKLDVIKKQAYCDFALWGGVSHNSMIDEDWHDSMIDLHKAGVIGFKAYLISSMDTFKELSVIEMGQVMQHSTKIGALVGVHAEEKDMIQTREEELKKLGKDSLFDYYFSRSDPAERQGVGIALQLARQTRCKLHVVHVGSTAAAQLINQAKMMKLDVTAETCPHFLEFTFKDFETHGSLIKTAPVVKTTEDKKGLWSGLKDGAIDFVATDHAPCPKKDKETGSAWTDYNGMPGVELRLPYLFSEGYMKKKLTLSKLVDITSTNAAKRFGLYPNKGSIKEGSDADLVIINPAEIWRVHGSDLYSKAKWTPFENQTFTGKIIGTILRGKIVYSDESGIQTKSGFGKFIKRAD